MTGATEKMIDATISTNKKIKAIQKYINSRTDKFNREGNINWAHVGDTLRLDEMLQEICDTFGIK